MVDKMNPGSSNPLGGPSGPKKKPASGQVPSGPSMPAAPADTPAAGLPGDSTSVAGNKGKAKLGINSAAPPTTVSGATGVNPAAGDRRPLRHVTEILAGATEGAPAAPKPGPVA